MRIISHRGFWLTPEEKNQPVAFRRTLKHGFGTETDVRDAMGTLVVSHDPPAGGEMSWGELVSSFCGSGVPLAVNVKSDGIAPLLAQSFQARNVEWFAFDMSTPEMVRFSRLSVPFYTRHSDVEPEPTLYDAALGVWLDAFHHEWFGLDTIRGHLKAGKQVCVVSSELHGRDPKGLWNMLQDIKRDPNLMLCTDRPDLAREAFSL